MRRSTITIAVLGTAAALTLTACSSSGGTKSTSTGSASSGGKYDVGVVLPDTTTSNRYTLYDQPLLAAAFKKAGLKATIQNAHGSNDTFVSDAQTMITQGVKVLLIDPADPATGITVEKQAQQHGVKVIDYDRVNLGGSAQYYVSFDNEKVGEQQATGLVSCINAKGIKHANVIMMNGGTDIDNNAVLFKAGAHKVLDPLFADGTLKKGPETDVSKWDNTTAATDFQQDFTTDPNVQAVLAANDGIAGAVISTLKAHHLQVPVTGQDSTVQGIQAILSGDQCLTIFKDVSKEATAASELAIDLIKGNTSAANTLASGSLKDPKNGRTIPSLLLPAEVITKSNINDVIKAGALTKAQICTSAYAKACAAAGIS